MASGATAAGSQGASQVPASLRPSGEEDHPSSPAGPPGRAARLAVLLHQCRWSVYVWAMPAACEIHNN